MPVKKTNELKVGQWVRIQAVEDETDRQPIEVDDNTIGIIIEDATHIDDCGYRVRYDDGHDGWYYRDELTPMRSYEKLREECDELLAACEWLTNLACGIGKDGEIPTEQEWIDATKAGMAAIVRARGEGTDASAESE